MELLKFFESAYEKLFTKSFNDQVISFFKKHPSPSDNEVHNFAESLGISPDELEEIIYNILSTELDKSDIIPGGLADKKEKSDFDPKKIKQGVEVELEHTDDPAIASEIAMDHLMEDQEYYHKLKTIEKSKNPSLLQYFDVIYEFIKAGRRRSNLIPKKITDKNGVIRTVWVKPTEEEKKKKGKKQLDEGMFKQPKKEFMEYIYNKFKDKFKNEGISKNYMLKQLIGGNVNAETKEDGLQLKIGNKEITFDKNEMNTGKPSPIKKKEPTKKEPTKKEPTKKEPTKKEPTKKELTKKEPTKKEPTKKEPTKKEPTKKEPEKDAFTIPGTSIQTGSVSTNYAMNELLIQRIGHNKDKIEAIKNYDLSTKLQVLAALTHEKTIGGKLWMNGLFSKPPKIRFYTGKGKDYKELPQNLPSELNKLILASDKDSRHNLKATIYRDDSGRVKGIKTSHFFLDLTWNPRLINLKPDEKLPDVKEPEKKKEPKVKKEPEKKGLSKTLSDLPELVPIGKGTFKNLNSEDIHKHLYENETHGAKDYFKIQKEGGIDSTYLKTEIKNGMEGFNKFLNATKNASTDAELETILADFVPKMSSIINFSKNTMSREWNEKKIDLKDHVQNMVDATIKSPNHFIFNQPNLKEVKNSTPFKASHISTMGLGITLGCFSVNSNVTENKNRTNVPREINIHSGYGGMVNENKHTESVIVHEFGHAVHRHLFVKQFYNKVKSIKNGYIYSSLKQNVLNGLNIHNSLHRGIIGTLSSNGTDRTFILRDLDTKPPKIRYFKNGIADFYQFIREKSGTNFVDSYQNQHYTLQNNHKSYGIEAFTRGIEHHEVMTNPKYKELRDQLLQLDFKQLMYLKTYAQNSSIGYIYKSIEGLIDGVEAYHRYGKEYFQRIENILTEKEPLFEEIEEKEFKSIKTFNWKKNFENRQKIENEKYPNPWKKNVKFITR